MDTSYDFYELPVLLQEAIAYSKLSMISRGKCEYCGWHVLITQIPNSKVFESWPWHPTLAPRDVVFKKIANKEYVYIGVY